MATTHGGVVGEADRQGTWLTGQVPLRGMIMTGKVMVMTLTELLANNAALSGEVKRSHEALKIAQLTIVECSKHSLKNVLIVPLWLHRGSFQSRTRT